MRSLKLPSALDWLFEIPIRLRESLFGINLWKSDKQNHAGPKIFIIGFNKTGTRSLHQFFQRNNLPGVHWDRSHLVACFERNIVLGKKLLSDGYIRNIRASKPGLYEDKKVFSDMTNPATDQEAKDYYKRLDLDYPNSKFILNIRDTPSWIESRFNHCNGQYVKRQLKFYDLPDTEVGRKKLKSIYSKMHKNHHRDVIEYFKGREKDLLIFDILRDDIEKLVVFFEGVYRLNPRHSIHLGKTKIGS